MILCTHTQCPGTCPYARTHSARKHMRVHTHTVPGHLHACAHMHTHCPGTRPYACTHSAREHACVHTHTQCPGTHTQCPGTCMRVRTCTHSALAHAHTHTSPPSHAQTFQFSLPTLCHAPKGSWYYQRSSSFLISQG